MTLGIGLLYGARGLRFLMSEVSPYSHCPSEIKSFDHPCFAGVDDLNLFDSTDLFGFPDLFCSTDLHQGGVAARRPR